MNENKLELANFKFMLETIKKAYGMNDKILAIELGLKKQTLIKWLNAETIPQTKNYKRVKSLYEYVIENNILQNKEVSQSKTIEKIEKQKPTSSKATKVIEKTEKVIEEPKTSLKVEKPKEIIEETRKLEIINNPEDIFNDIRKVSYSKRLKEVFGINASSILTTFNDWANYNKKENRNFYEGEYWCTALLSVAYLRWFRYFFSSEAKFTEEVEKLLQHGLLVKKVVNTTKKSPLVLWRVDKKRLTELYNKKCSRLNQ